MSTYVSVNFGERQESFKFSIAIGAPSKLDRPQVSKMVSNTHTERLSKQHQRHINRSNQTCWSAEDGGIWRVMKGLFEQLKSPSWRPQKKNREGEMKKRPWPQACWFVSLTAVCLNLCMTCFLIDGFPLITLVGERGEAGWHPPRSSESSTAAKALMVS